MNKNRVISTAVLLLLLGTTLPSFAQKGEEEKGGNGGKPQEAQHEQQPQRAQQAKPQVQREQQAKPQAQHEQQAKPQPQQRTEKAQPQRAENVQPQGRTQAVAPNNRGEGQYGRISNANYSAHFGHGHSFHMGRPQMINGYNRFQYGGYWFGYNQAWPAGWDYNDDCYVAFEGGAYYMYDVRHPGIHITLSIF